MSKKGSITVSRIWQILVEEGLVALLRKAVWEIWMTLVSMTPTEWIPIPVIKRLFRIRSKLNPTTSDANPCKIVWVDPDSVEYFIRDGPRRYSAVVDGDWDKKVDQFETHPVYRSIKNRYVNGCEWHETELYREYAHRIEDGNPYWRCRTKKELNGYFRNIDNLHNSIITKGYKSQRELLKEYPHQTRRKNTDAIHPILNEVGVNIHRDGTISKRQGGNHRLAIAQVENINKIPVIVRVRHEIWQELRDEVRNADAFTELSDGTKKHMSHPDLRDIVPKEWIDERM